MAAEGPKTLELAGEIADGVNCGMGLTPDIVELTLHHLKIGAEKSCRTLDDLDIWTLVRVNVGENRQELQNEIRMELTSSAHHVFRFTMEGKKVPPELVDIIEKVQKAYQPKHHEDLGESPNAQIMREPAFLDYMTERFAVLGTEEECVQQIQRIRDAGIHNLLFTGFVHDKRKLIENLGKNVLPKLRG
jgi:alkanesulfonate monooxygenase SsuD/methylene tetrahydromethanopterin reductase-like flavin-dependent oxidoreductase (luciferase family)